MARITNYILRQLGVGMILVSIGLACILWLTQSLRFVELIINKGLTIGAFLQLTMMLLPNFLIVILPISLFAIVLFTYNKLIMDRELVVLRAAGLSHLSLARPALILALLVTMVGYSLTLHFVPESVRQFREMQWTIRNDVSRILLQEGVFNDMGDGLTIYLRSRSQSGELLGILVHDQRKPEKPVTLMAERGALLRTETGPRVLMVNGSRQEVRAGTGQLSLLYFDSYTMDFGGDEGGDVRFRDARERNMDELLNPSDEIRDVDRRRFVVEAHQRLATPLFALSFALLALASLLIGGFSRYGQAGKILLAIGLMVGVQTASLGFANLAAVNLALVPLIYVNVILPAVIAGVLLWRPLSFSPRSRGALPSETEAS